MKEYYYHEDGKQLGPFTLEVLKEKNINSKTLIWTEGMEDWVPAETVSELADLFKKTPPPPPITKSTPPSVAKEIKRPQIQKQKSSNTKKKLIWGIGLILVIILSFVVIGIIQNPSNNVLNEVGLKPKPRVLDKNYGEDPTSTLFNYKVGIDAQIINDGSAGNILVRAYIYSNGKKLEQSKEIFLNKDEYSSVHFVFEEISLGSVETSYDVVVQSLD